MRKIVKFVTSLADGLIVLIFGHIRLKMGQNQCVGSDKSKKRQNMKNQIIKSLFNGAILVTLLAAVAQTVSASPSPLTTPDGGSTTAIVGLVCAGLVVVRKYVRR
jgi:hypothetical protein